MNAIKLSTLAVVVAAVAAIPTATAQPPPPTPTPTPRAQPRPATPAPPARSAQAALREVQQQLGFIPQFLRQIPAALLPSFVDQLVFQDRTDTALDPKTKQLIGLAVAAQIPCHYCVYFHTRAARSLGATDAEIAEAIGVAGVTREGSTLLNGLQIDEGQFRRDVDRMMRGDRSRSARRTSTRPIRQPRR